MQRCDRCVHVDNQRCVAGPSGWVTRKPVNIFMVVDLPAPFGPRKAHTWPAGTRKRDALGGDGIHRSICRGRWPRSSRAWFARTCVRHGDFIPVKNTSTSKGGKRHPIDSAFEKASPSKTVCQLESSRGIIAGARQLAQWMNARSRQNVTGNDRTQ